MDEDLYFPLAGKISSHFLVPNAVRAARFFMVLTQRQFYGMTCNCTYGGHAWKKWDKEFWMELFEQYNLIGVIYRFSENNFETMPVEIIKLSPKMSNFISEKL